MPIVSASGPFKRHKSHPGIPGHQQQDVVATSDHKTFVEVSLLSGMLMHFRSANFAFGFQTFHMNNGIYPSLLRLCELIHVIRSHRSGVLQSLTPLRILFSDYCVRALIHPKMYKIYA